MRVGSRIKEQAHRRFCFARERRKVWLPIANALGITPSAMLHCLSSQDSTMKNMFSMRVAQNATNGKSFGRIVRYAPGVGEQLAGIDAVSQALFYVAPKLPLGPNTPLNALAKGHYQSVQQVAAAFAQR